LQGRSQGFESPSLHEMDTSTPRSRRFFIAAGVTASAIFLSGCTITASGSGTVTITSDQDAVTFDPVAGTGSVARVCAATSATCEETDPYLFTYYPLSGTNEWIVGPGFPVINRSGQQVGLPAGRYTLQVTEYRPAALLTNAIVIDIFTTGERDLTIWHQSYGRDSSDTECATDWEPSWAQWPHDGGGGFVCNRQIYAYFPDEPVAR
jgi:hypothetical protein